MRGHLTGAKTHAQKGLMQRSIKREENGKERKKNEIKKGEGGKTRSKKFHRIRKRKAS